MFIVLYAILIIFICGMAGVSIIKICRMDSNLFITGPFAPIVPLIGAVSLISMLQIFGLGFTMQQMSIFFLFIFIIIFFYTKNDIYNWLMHLKTNIPLLIILLAALFFSLFPLLIKGELTSAHSFNHDIIFYLSTMDFFQGHTLLQKPPFSPELPFYSMADIILLIQKTRFGSDMLCAFFMCLFQLEPHHLFTLMGAVYVVFGISSLYVLADCGLKLNKLTSYIFAALLSVSSVWVELIAHQYIPHILGMACLFGFITGTIGYFSQNEKKYLLFTALMASGVAAVYAEFVSYMLVIFLIIMGAYAISRKQKNSRFDILKKFYIIPLSLVINPVGAFVAFRFNFNMLQSTIDSGGRVGGIHGNSSTFDIIIIRLLGFLPLSNTGIVFADSPLNIKLYYIILVFISIVFIALFFLSIIKAKQEETYIVTGILFFFFSYGLLFTFNDNHYALYKHLLTIAPLVLLFLFYFGDRIFQTYGAKVRLISICVFSCIFIIGNFINIYIRYNPKTYYYYDNALMEIRDYADLIIGDAPLGIINGNSTDVHAITYALRDRPVILFEGGVNDGAGYYQHYLRYDRTEAAYVIAPRHRHDGDIFQAASNDIIWQNKKYAIYKNDFIMHRLSGFYGFEIIRDIRYRWTSENISGIGIINNSGEGQYFNLSFYASNGPFGNVKTINLYADGNFISTYMSDNIITIDDIYLEAGEEFILEIETEEPLDVLPPPSSDTRVFGVRISDVIINKQGIK